MRLPPRPNRHGRSRRSARYRAGSRSGRLHRAGTDSASPARPLRGWLATITLNKARDWARRRKVRRLLGLALPANAASWIPDDAPLPDEVAEQRDALAATARAIAALPASLKDVLLLRTLEGLSQAETARALGISEQAVEDPALSGQTETWRAAKG